MYIGSFLNIGSAPLTKVSALDAAQVLVIVDVRDARPFRRVQDGYLPRPQRERGVAPGLNQNVAGLGDSLELRSKAQVQAAIVHAG